MSLTTSFRKRCYKIQKIFLGSRILRASLTVICVVSFLLFLCNYYLTLYFLEDKEPFVVPNVPEWLWGSGKTPGKKLAKDNISCFLCGAQIMLKNMREHVSSHIILAGRGMDDTKLLGGMEVAADPCGWCGSRSCGLAVRDTANQNARQEGSSKNKEADQIKLRLCLSSTWDDL